MKDAFLESRGWVHPTHVHLTNMWICSACYAHEVTDVKRTGYIYCKRTVSEGEARGRMNTYCLLEGS
jgi:hypothetical protein